MVSPCCFNMGPSNLEYNALLTWLLLNIMNGQVKRALISKLRGTRHCVKSPYSEFFGPYFPAFGLNRETQSIFPYSVEMQENRDQKNSEYGYFSSSEFQRNWLTSNLYQPFILRSIKKTTRLEKTVDILKNSFYKQFREFSGKRAWKNTWLGKVGLF